MTTVERAPQVITAGWLARHLNVSRNRVIHVLRTRPHIAPEYRAGNTRLYGQAVIAQLRHELNAIDARRTSREAAAGSDAPSLFPPNDDDGGEG